MIVARAPLADPRVRPLTLAVTDFTFTPRGAWTLIRIVRRLTQARADGSETICSAPTVALASASASGAGATGAGGAGVGSGGAGGVGSGVLTGGSGVATASAWASQVKRSDSRAPWSALSASGSQPVIV